MYWLNILTAFFRSIMYMYVFTWKCGIRSSRFNNICFYYYDFFFFATGKNKASSFGRLADVRIPIRAVRTQHCCCCFWLYIYIYYKCIDRFVCLRVVRRKSTKGVGVVKSKVRRTTIPLAVAGNGSPQSCARHSVEVAKFSVEKIPYGPVFYNGDIVAFIARAQCNLLYQITFLPIVVILVSRYRRHCTVILPRHLSVVYEQYNETGKSTGRGGKVI